MVFITLVFRLTTFNKEREQTKVKSGIVNIHIQQLRTLNIIFSPMSYCILSNKNFTTDLFIVELIIIENLRTRSKKQEDELPKFW